MPKENAKTFTVYAVHTDNNGKNETWVDVGQAFNRISDGELEIHIELDPAIRKIGGKIVLSNANIEPLPVEEQIAPLVTNIGSPVLH